MSCNGDCRFDSFFFVNRAEEPVDIEVVIKRNGETVVDTTVTAPGTKNGNEQIKEIIDLIDDKSGEFVVTVTTDRDELTINVTEAAGSKQYTLAVYISKQGDLTALTNQNR